MRDAAETHDLAINWFRQASPYINAHRRKTMVLCLPDSMLGSDLTGTLIHDLTLLSHLGLRLIVCFGLREQVNARLERKHENSTVIDGRRITDDAALSEIMTAAGRTRARLEASLSMGLPNTPMAGARLSVCSGNFISARPFGVHDGVDYQHTGTVRQVHVADLNTQLAAGNLVLMPPLGYSLTGDMFNLPAEEIATQTAIALQADKLVFFVPELPQTSNGDRLRQASSSILEQLMPNIGDQSLVRTLTRSVQATSQGVDRVHLLDMHDPNALLRELFTRDGSGTLVTTALWESVRSASIADVNGIIGLIAPLQDDGTLATRSREQLELDIKNFVVSERDGMVISCAALYLYGNAGDIGTNNSHDDPTPDSTTQRHLTGQPENSIIGEIACVATHPDYQGHGRAEALVSYLENKAMDAGVEELVLLTTRTAHWFIQRGYVEQSPDVLPASRRSAYNRQRNSKVFIKLLRSAN